MPMLLTGYKPADIPAPGVESVGLGTKLTPQPSPRGYVVTPSWSAAGMLGLAPAPVELRTPGLDDRPAMNPRAQLADRIDRDDADSWTVNNGSHVAQVPGAAIPSGAMAGEPAVYGDTWRLEPTPAAHYIGGR